MSTDNSKTILSLKEIFSELLHLDPSEVPADNFLLEIGADSLTLVEAI